MTCRVKRPHVSVFVLIAAGAFFSSSVLAGDPERGRDKAMQCVSCHGIEGRATNPSFPRLAGQNPTYLAIQLQEFKTGERYHPVMSPIAEALTDEDIEDLATYYSRLGDSDET